MSTRSINPYSNQNNNNSNDTAKKAGIAAAAVGVAGAGTAAAMAVKNHLDNTADEENVVSAEEEVIPTEETPISTPKPEPVPEHRHHKPEPRHTPDQDDKPRSNPETDPVDNPKDNPENPEEEHTDEPNDGKKDEPLTQEKIEEYDDNNLDPNQEVDQVLAEENIDHSGDAESTEDMFIHDYEEVRMISGADGEAQVVATAYDANGNPIVLVDVDGDQMFDQGYYGDGGIVDVSELAINVGDAELDAASNEGYLANNGENADNFDGADFNADIIS